MNTDKGRQALDWSKVTKKELSVEVASRYNAGLSSITKPHPKRADFFAALDASPRVIDLIDKSLRPSFKLRVRLALRRYKQHIKRVLKKLIWGGIIYPIKLFPILKSPNPILFRLYHKTPRFQPSPSATSRVVGSHIGWR